MRARAERASTPARGGWRPQFAALSAIWGASFLFIKVAVGDLAPIDVALGRVALGALALLPLVAARPESLPAGRRVWGHLAVTGALFSSVPFSLFSYGETHASSVLAGIWNATTPLLTVLVSLAALPDERPTAQRLGGLLVGFTGVLVVLGPWQGVGGSELAGQLMFLGAATCYALGYVYTRRYLSDLPYSGASLSAGQLICASAQLGVATIFVGESPHALGADAVGSMLALGVLGTGLAYVFNYRIVRVAGATTAATVTYLVPLFSTLLGVVVLGEEMTWNEPLGGLVVLAGVAISQRAAASVAREAEAAA